MRERQAGQHHHGQLAGGPGASAVLGSVQRKFAVEGLIETLRHEVRLFGIQFAMVEPGAIGRGHGRCGAARRGEGRY
jgi:hypothetical protein